MAKTTPPRSLSSAYKKERDGNSSCEYSQGYAEGEDVGLRLSGSKARIEEDRANLYYPGTRQTVKLTKSGYGEVVNEQTPSLGKSNHCLSSQNVAGNYQAARSSKNPSPDNLLQDQILRTGDTVTAELT